MRVPSRFVKDEATRKNLEAVGSEIDRLNRALSSPPTTGTWRVGDRVWNSEPSPSEYVGWVCVVSGSPGTWRGFGVIQS